MGSLIRGASVTWIVAGYLAIAVIFGLWWMLAIPLALALVIFIGAHIVDRLR